jgi:glycosyltransferase involved in cell wall biosynthesis
VEAFAQVHRNHPDSRLIIVGDGPLRPDIETLVEQLGLAGSVRLTGLQPNPWSIMARCQAFALSSDYEGQPMVILEARTLGLPVVSTAFGSVRSALGPDEGLIVDRTVAGLAAGMDEVVRGQAPSRPLDPAAYNSEAVREFCAAIGLITHR